MVYITFPERSDAEAAARRLVEERLAAGVNIVSGVRSIYRWKGRVETADETVLWAKTTRARLPALTAAVVAGHPYETPAVAAFDLVGGAAAYLDWIAAETEAGD